jgi:TetR/AcrR family transcriptional repressor of nem operon
MDEAIRRTGAFMRGRLFERIEEKPAGARGEVVLKRYLSAAHRDDPANGCPMPAIAGEVATSTPEHRAVLAEQVGLLADQLASHLVPEPAASRRTTALAMIALMYGGISLARAVKDTDLSDEILRACRAFGKGQRS